MSSLDTPLMDLGYCSSEEAPLVKGCWRTASTTTKHLAADEEEDPSSTSFLTEPSSFSTNEGERFRFLEDSPHKLDSSMMSPDILKVSALSQRNEYCSDTSSCEDTIPYQVVCIQDYSSCAECDSHHTENLVCRLQETEDLAAAYKKIIDSTDHLVESLHLTVREADDCCGEIAKRFGKLEAVFEEVEADCRWKRCLACFLLCFYFLGGSEYVLVMGFVFFILEDCVLG